MTRLADILDPKSNNFSLLRLLAASAVVVSHAVLLRTGNKADEIFAGTSVYNLGDHAVNVFFVLSGLMVAASLARSTDALNFIIARALRIFPALIVCIVLLMAWGGALSECGLWQYLFDARVLTYAVKTISLSSGSADLPGVFAANPYPSIVNASLWTLKFEVLCYALLALLGKFGLMKRNSFSILVCIFWVLAGSILVSRHGELTSLEQALRLTFSFSFGVTLYVFRDKVRISAWIVACLGVFEWLTLGSTFERIAGPVAVGYAAVWLGSFPIDYLRTFTNRVDLSYGVYIFGWPISQTLIQLCPQIAVVPLVIYSGLLSGLAAILSWKLIEKPCLDLRPSVRKVLLREAPMRRLWQKLASWPRSRSESFPRDSAISGS